jgi:hypothetical protein
VKERTLFERSINEAELVLSMSKEPLITVRSLWDEVVRRARIQNFEVAALTDFSAMLEGDNRFQIVAAGSKNQNEIDSSVEDDYADENMEDLGFFSEDRVRLRISQAVHQVTEEEEEVGSIRRKAFVSHAGTDNGKNLKKVRQSNGSVPVKDKRKKRAPQKEPDLKKKRVSGKKTDKRKKGKR